MTEGAKGQGYALSVDIGGTFTDFSLLNLSTGEVSVNKVLTDPERPAEALMGGAGELLERMSLGFGELQVVVHSTTLATNAIIERKGAKTALLTTKGFRDVLEMGREQIYDLYKLQAQLPDPLVPRYLRQEVAERISRDGEVLQKLDQDAALEVVESLQRDGVEAVAVSLLHAYKNAEHETALKTALASRFPGLTVSVSSEVAPVINEYERTSTTVADCYIKPRVSAYLRDIEERLKGAGYGGRLLVMHSAGGVLEAERASERPIRLLESGPAAGALAASFYSELLEKPDLISLDMGGTTAKTCVIEGGEPAVTNNIEVARMDRFKTGSGLPMVIPVLDLIEIGSGGGSVAWVDNLGLMKVGPHSAGARPGPACYGQGGTEPTVTDANLLLGYLNPEYFLGGRMKLDVAAAKGSLTGLAGSLGISETEATWGIYSVVTENMAAAARIHIISRNKDPRKYAIIAFGGAGPLHACEVARVLGVRQVIAPLAAGVTSALGCLTAPLSFEEVRSLPGLLTNATNWELVNRLFGELEEWGREMMRNAGVAAEEVKFVRSSDMRLVGQIHEINVPIPDGKLGAESVDEIESAFHEIYQKLYSRRNLNIPVQVQNWRMLVQGPQPQVELKYEAEAAGADATAALKGTREAYFPAAGGYVQCPVYDRYGLRSGTTIEGPAIIEEQESTAIVGPRDRVRVDPWLNLIIDVG